MYVCDVVPRVAGTPTAPVITTPLMEQNVPYQGQATFECLATGSPYPEYRWFKNEEPISEQNLPILYISNVQVSDRGLYSCHVTNSEGSDKSQEVYLTIAGAPRLSGFIHVKAKLNSIDFLPHWLQFCFNMCN